MSTVTSVIDNIMSWQFAGGFVFGLLSFRVYCMWKAHKLDRTEPLPHGEHHRAGGISRIWAAGAIAVVTMAYSLVETQENSTRVQDLAATTLSCQREFNEALTQRARISEQNDRLSLTQRDALADWIHELLNPPEDIKDLLPSDPKRQEWGYRITERYYGVIGWAQERQRELAEERKAHPLPETTCGK